MVWLVAVGGGPALRFVDGAVLRAIRSNVAVLADAHTVTGGGVVFRRELEATLAARSRARLPRRDCVFLGSFFVAAHSHGFRLILVGLYMAIYFAIWAWIAGLFRRARLDRSQKSTAEFPL